MSKSFMNIPFWGGLIASFLMPGKPAAADSVSVQRSFVNIKFDEPVISQGTQQNNYNDEATAAEKGTDLFDITGDAAYLPTARWVDQDRLQLVFAKGTPATASYRLSFRPGMAKYLSGKEMPQGAFEFKPAAVRLNGMNNSISQPGSSAPNGAVIVFPDQGNLQQNASLAPDAVRYVFREPKTGAEIPGKASRAQLKHFDSVIVDILRKDASRSQGEGKGIDWRALTPETPMERYVIVQPEKPLPHAKKGWELVAQTPKGSGYRAGVVQDGIEFPDALSFDASTSILPTEKGSAYCINVEFNAHITQEMAGEAFRNMTIASGNAQAVNSADGQSKTMQVGGKTVTFSLLRHEEQADPAWIEGDLRVGYVPPYTGGFRIMVQGAEMPLTLDLGLNKGIRSAFGMEMKGDLRQRVSLAPALPQLSKPGVDMAAPAIVLPLNGERKIRLSCLKHGKLHVRAARFSAEALQGCWEELRRNRTWSTDKENIQKYAQQLAKARKEAGIKDGGYLASSLESRWRNERIEAFRSLAERYRPFFGDEKTYEIGASADGDEGPAGLDIDLDDLAKGGLKPGFYIISVTGEPTEDVRAACREIGAPEDLFRDEAWYAVQVTDLMAARIAPGLMVTHLSDGSPVTEGRAEPFHPGDGRALGWAVDVRGGVAVIEGNWRYALVRSGEDFCVAESPYGVDPPTDEDMIHVVTDRTLYRPGDTVRLRGILRHVSAAGVASLPALKEARLEIRRPNGEILRQETAKVNEYGAFDCQFALPDGEEDVTGSYIALVDCGEFGKETVSLPCEVFRRDAFEARLECRVASEIRPKEFTVSVKSKDYNGTPLSGGKVQLHINLPSGSCDKELRLDDKGECHYTESLAIDYDKDGEGRLSVTGSVCNDREEYVRLKYAGSPLLMADFRPAFLERGDRLVLRKSESKEKGKILDRDQTVHVKLMAYDMKEERLPNGFILFRQEETCIWEGDATVPANCWQGVSLGLLEKWQAWKQDKQKDSRPAPDRNAVAKITAQDAAGNPMQASLMLWDKGREEAALVAEGVFDSLENGVLKAHANFRHGGKAIGLLRSLKGVRTFPIEVKAGRNDFALPLEEGECGNLTLAVVLPIERQGCFHKVEAMEIQALNPRKDVALEVKLDPFAQPLRPGSKAGFGGVVRTADGAAVAEAQVTLFAVDAGMLSVSRYSVKDLAEVFSNERKDSLLRLYAWRQHYAAFGQMRLPLERQLCPMPGLWNGTRLRDSIGDPYFGGMTYGRGAMVKRAAAMPTAYACGNATALCVAADMGCSDSCAFDEECAAAPAPGEAGAAPRLRTNFAPVAVWAPALQTDKDGRFYVEAQLPDTLTTYRVFALALGKDGKTFGNGQTELTVNQPVMLTPGAPLFMSTGDVLRLPLTITNNTDADGTWQVRLEGSDDTRQVTLKAKSTATLYFDYKATEEGERKLRWTAQGAEGADAVEGSFAVVFPAPLLKESHHLILKEGESPVKAADLLDADLAQSSRGGLEVALSANPLLHLQGCMEFALNYPYGCTEQTASALLPWLFYDRLAPFSPKMAETPAPEVRKLVDKAVCALLERQQPDGGFAYWGDSHESCLWVSSHAGMVLLIAREQGYSVPDEAMEKLRKYLKAETEAQGKALPDFPAMELYKIGTLCGDVAMAKSALRCAAAENEGAEPLGRSGLCPWLRTHRVSASLKFINALYQGADKDQAFLRWMRAAGRDYRHVSTHDSGWMFFALHEYLKRTPAQAAQAEAILNDGTKLPLGNGVTRLAPATAGALASIPLEIRAGSGIVYAVVKAKARPERTEYPGLTERGLQVTRVYEKCGADGVWRPAAEFNVGDIVRVSLTCAKADADLEYFVLEDCLPSSMEAINPNVPGQAAGLPRLPWSMCFDHKEYLADRVRGFCTRWAGRDLLNMSYYARVKRAGVSIAPPAQAQLMYEPQTYGLSENKVITSK